MHPATRVHERRAGADMPAGADDGAEDAAAPPGADVDGAPMSLVQTSSINDSLSETAEVIICVDTEESSLRSMSILQLRSSISWGLSSRVIRASTRTALTSAL